MILPLAALIAAGFGFTAWKARALEAAHPNIGTLTDIGGYRLNALHLPPPPTADLPPIVFIHGASGNLQDQAQAFLKPLQGRSELLFVDRPGHGYSERGGLENDLPSGQADAIAALMDRLDIEKAIILGHSLGGAIAASFALRHPQRTAGLVLLSAATHPWPGGIEWYYHAATRPIFGWLFTRLLSLPAGLVLMDGATRAVFHPNPRPDTYVKDGAPALVLRPESFRNNAVDVLHLNTYLAMTAPHYGEITAPTVAITGDVDKIVSPEIHSRTIASQIAGAELVVIRGLGHKPDYLATDVVIAALEKLAGQSRDLQTAARAAEARLAPDAHEPEPEMDFSIEKP
jgi:pimeloyl-ACP methyl ester carboxylesterase